MTSGAKLALPLSAMPGSTGSLPMTPRAAMLTPRRLGLSGTAKVSCALYFSEGSRLLALLPSHMPQQLTLSLCVFDLLPRYRAAACTCALEGHPSFWYLASVAAVCAV